MFLGRFDHTLDGKGRIAVPSRFRDSLVDGLVLTRGIDRCVTVYPLGAWETLANRVNGLPLADRDARQFRRLVFAEAIDTRLDAQGRILIPVALRAYAAIEREAIVVGIYDSIEIWCPATWNETYFSLEASGEHVASRLADML